MVQPTRTDMDYYTILVFEKVFFPKVSSVGGKNSCSSEPYFHEPDEEHLGV
jgi:hypothetical protein